MSRRRNNITGNKWHSSVSVPLDEEVAAQLDRAMIAFGLESRSETASLAVRAWLAASMEDATIHQMVQLALKQIRENEVNALVEFHKQRALQYGAAR